MAQKEKTWRVLEAPTPEFLSAHPELPPIIAQLLWTRNIRDQEKIDEFLNPDYSTDLHDPYLFNEMPKAVEIIFTAIKKQKNIVVHGDYDADGVSAATILVSTLRKFGAKHVSVFIPHREIDGYGLNLNTINLLHEQKTDLIITCDCGISNREEVVRAKDLGLQVVITDHHAVPEKLPPADAIIHPLVPGEKYPDKGLAGAAVAFKLVQALLKKHQESNEYLLDGQPHESYEKWLLDLVAIATVGDMVPLLGESRTLTRYGLTVLNKTRNLGLRKLMQIAGLTDEFGKPKRGQFTTETISFQLAPRINAAGRMDHANTAYMLLMSEDPKEAETLAIQLNQNNLDRQKLTESLVAQAREQIKSTNQEKNPIIFILGTDWSTGILGLIAGKIKEEFYRPTIVMGLNDGEVTGSGRSIPEFNMIKNMQARPEFFDKYGGHPQACGFSLKSPDILEDFKSALLKKAEEQFDIQKLQPTITIDAEVDLEDVNWKLYDLLKKFEPFGQANEEPRYLAKGLTVASIDPVGQDGKHLRLLVKHNTHTIKKTIAFGFGDKERHPSDWKNALHVGDKIDMVFSVDVNEWNGNRELQLTVIDIKMLSQS
ncbi:MAG TPA: single-stranded-DNA-specific exonuclease RecJ [Patescibacteria group bacterium]|nr:single-stranded-DNA-specific exonuclease RecJ [Patescibacteria group bacterium]